MTGTRTMVVGGELVMVGVEVRGLERDCSDWSGCGGGMWNESRVRAGLLIQEDIGVLRNKKKREKSHVWASPFALGKGNKLLGAPQAPWAGQSADYACLGLQP